MSGTVLTSGKPVEVREDQQMAGRYAKFWSQFEEARYAAPADRAKPRVFPHEAKPSNDIEPLFVYEPGYGLFDADLVQQPEARRVLKIGSPDTTDDDRGSVVRRPVGGHTHEFFANTRLYRNQATPHHLISICDVNLCPASEPRPPQPPESPLRPAPVHDQGGLGVTIGVVDTGFIDKVKEAEKAAHETIFEHVSGEVRKPFTVEGLIRLYAGHGTFIGGLIGAVAPETEVKVANAMHWAGAAWEFDLGPGLSSALADNPDIISLSAGGTTLDNLRYLGLRPFLDELARNDHTLLVAAVGNEGGPNLLMPAAEADGRKDIVSVGALREDLKGMACFSNYGPGVKVYAPGERLVGAFPTGDYEYVEPTRDTCRYHDPALYLGCTCVGNPHVGDRAHFDRRAIWSGTSFSTPIVAAMIAAHLSADTDKRLKGPRDAFGDLLRTEGFKFNLDGASPTTLGTGMALVPRSMRP